MAPGECNAGEGASPGLPGLLVEGAVVAQKYKLCHALGSGGMGVVWAAREAGSGALSALKFLRVGPGGTDDPDAVRRFLREARAAASVRHPHVVAIREVLELDGGQPVMVMELLAGESLRQRLGRDQRMSLEETARILLPVASAVGTAHQQGIVHRDLKPDNIFLSQDAAGVPTVKVLDFGIAKVTRIDGQSTHNLGLTGSGEVLGTPNYMSPEQVFGERDIDHRADIWSLGVILYECLSGIVPTKAANVGQVFKLIVAGGIKPLGSVLPGVPADVAELAQRMLSRRREQRPFDLNEIAQVLGRYTKAVVPAFGPPHLRANADSGSGEYPYLAAPTASEALPNADETLKRRAVTGEPAVPEDPAVRARRSRIGRLTTIGLGTLAVAVLVGESLLLWRSHARKTDQAARVGEPAVVARPAPADAAAPPPGPAAQK